jgi:hypothetical protein
MKTGEKLAKLLRIAGFLIIGGFLVEVLTLIWSHPVSFLLYMGIGGVLMVAGIVLFLYAVVSHA